MISTPYIIKFRYNVNEIESCGWKTKKLEVPLFQPPPYINKGLINNVQPLFFKAKFPLPLDKGLKLCHSSDLTKNCPNYFKICAAFGQVSTIFYEFAASPAYYPVTFLLPTIMILRVGSW